MTIRKRLSLLFVGLLSLLLVGGSVLTLTMRDAQRRADQTARAAHAQQYLFDLVSLAADVRPRNLARCRAQWAATRSALARLVSQDAALEGEERAALARLAPKTEDADAAFRLLAKTLEPEAAGGGPPDPSSSPPARARRDRLRAELRAHLTLDLRSTQAKLRHQQARLHEATRDDFDRLVILASVLLGTLLLSFVGLAWTTERSFLRPLGQVSEGMQKIAHEELEHRLALERSDELGALARAFDHMVERLEAQRDERARAESALSSKEEELRQAQKLEALGLLAGGIAHDFNNMLTVMKTYTEMAQGELESGSEAAEDMESVLQAAHKAQTLTHQLLAFARQKPGAPEPTDAAEVCAAMEKMLRRLLDASIALDLRIEPTSSRVVAGPGWLEQVVMNLVVNARDAVGARGHIRLEVVERELASTDPLLGDALAPGRCVVLSVIDDGEGMSEATLARVFEPFFTTKAPHRGTGLGLSTVRGIVHRMGGRIRCESAPGAGARFDVVLPAAAPEAEPASASAGASDLDLELSGRTVLIADDEPLIRAAVARALSAEGSRVLTADDGAAALALIEAEAASIDLLITDMVMPGAHGPEVAGRLRARRPEAQVLFLSGQGLAVDEVAPAPAPLLVKPFTLEDLTAAARAALAGRSSPASS